MKAPSRYWELQPWADPCLSGLSLSPVLQCPGHLLAEEKKRWS